MNQPMLIEGPTNNETLIIVASIITAALLLVALMRYLCKRSK